MHTSIKNSLRFSALGAVLVFYAGSGSAELLCDCTQVVDTCDASVSLTGSRVNIESSNESCSRVDYLIEGQPYTALVVGGSGELAGPSLPMRNSSVVVENCRVCAENGAIAAKPETNSESAPAPTEGSDEDKAKPRSMIKVMPDYPRRAWMNKLEGDVTVEFSVNPQGAVQNIKVINSSNRLFDLVAVDAVSRFKYTPAETDGAPVVASGIRERFQFRLLNGGTQTSVTSSTAMPPSG